MTSVPHSPLSHLLKNFEINSPETPHSAPSTYWINTAQQTNVQPIWDNFLATLQPTDSFNPSQMLNISFTVDTQGVDKHFNRIVKKLKKIDSSFLPIPENESKTIWSFQVDLDRQQIPSLDFLMQSGLIKIHQLNYCDPQIHACNNSEWTR